MFQQDISRRKQIIQEIETEIYEINAEQQYLLIKVRRLIREFLKALSAVGMEKNQALVNQYIANLILPSVVDTKKECFPITVTRRRTEDRLIERYFEVRRDTHNPPSETISEQGNTQRPSQFRSMSSFTGTAQITVIEKLSNYSLCNPPIINCRIAGYSGAPGT